MVCGTPTNAYGSNCRPFKKSLLFILCSRTIISTKQACRICLHLSILSVSPNNNCNMLQYLVRFRLNIRHYINGSLRADLITGGDVKVVRAVCVYGCQMRRDVSQRGGIVDRQLYFMITSLARS